MRHEAQRLFTAFLLLAAIALALAPRGVQAQLQFEQWKSLQFAPAEYGDPLVSGLTADPDFDSIRNLLEYGFHGHPKTPDTTFLPSIVAKPSW